MLPDFVFPEPCLFFGIFWNGGRQKRVISAISRTVVSFFGQFLARLRKITAIRMHDKMFLHTFARDFIHFARDVADDRRERTCQRQDVMKKTYHLCLSAGDEAMFRDLEDYHRGFNCFALALHRTGSTGLAEAIMATHTHQLIQTEDPNGLPPVNLTSIERGVNLQSADQMSFFEAGKADYRKVSDIGLCTEVDMLARNRYGRHSTYQLTQKEKQEIAEQLYRVRHLSEAQIRRCLALTK